MSADAKKVNEIVQAELRYKAIHSLLNKKGYQNKDIAPLKDMALTLLSMIDLEDDVSKATDYEGGEVPKHIAERAQKMLTLVKNPRVTPYHMMALKDLSTPSLSNRALAEIILPLDHQGHKAFMALSLDQISDRIQAHLQAEKAQMNSNLKPQFSAHVEKVGASNPSSGERDMPTRHFAP